MLSLFNVSHFLKSDLGDKHTLAEVFSVSMSCPPLAQRTISGEKVFSCYKVLSQPCKTKPQGPSAIISLEA